MSVAMLTMLLIVPNGIETVSDCLSSTEEVSLLIVPNGIETRMELLDQLDEHLLIVPNGIETAFGRAQKLVTESF